MFNAKREEKKKLAMACDQLLNEMLTYGPDSQEFKDGLDRLERVHKLRQRTKLTGGVSPDTVAIVLGNLMGIVIIVGYEQKHVVASAAQKFLLKTH